MKIIAEIDNLNMQDRPGMYPYQQRIADIEDDRIRFESDLKNQYIGFNDINIDIRLQYPNFLITEEIQQRFLIFFDDKIINIALLDTVLLNKRISDQYFNIVYQHFYVDFYNEIIKPMMSTYNLTDQKLIISEYTTEELRNNILGILTTKIDSLIKLSIANVDLKVEILNCNLLLDLYDNDLELFMDNFLIPYMSKE